ncbi:MAG: methyltransferase domain-containing protein [Aliidongia sp.]
MTKLSVALPSPPGTAEPPVWTGREFRIGQTSRRVLSFEVGESGWSEELFALHQEQAGGDHFIDIASRRHALGQLNQWLPGPGGVILEIGCSGGYFLRDLAAARPSAEIIGSDYTLAALEHLGSRLDGVPLLQFDLTRCPLPDGSVDAVVLLNVLEHIEQDQAALAQLHRILRPGGVLIAEVPAGSSLYDTYDRHLMHFRRYDMPGLLALITGGGFEVVAKSHLGFCLFPLFWLTKKLNRLRPPPSAAQAEKLVEASVSRTRRTGGLGHAIMAVEAWLRRRTYLPFGIRCLVAARKPA